MTEYNDKSSSDFAGFINGFQASNLETIQRNIALHLSEMQTRLGVIRSQLPEALNAVKPDLSEIDDAFRDPSGTIVDRLEFVGKLLTRMLIERGLVLKSNETTYSQIKRLIRAYVEAAEVSRNDRMVNAAVSVAEAFGETNASPKPTTV
jgi:hypothetical protein